MQAFAVKTLTTSSLMAFSLATLGAAEILWDGEAGDGQWTSATNWAGDVLPGPADTAVLRASAATGNITITVDQPQVIDGLQLIGADKKTVTVVGSTLSLGEVYAKSELHNESTGHFVSVPIVLTRDGIIGSNSTKKVELHLTHEVSGSYGVTWDVSNGSIGATELYIKHANSYTGATRFRGSGKVMISTDGAFGSGSDLYFDTNIYTFKNKGNTSGISIDQALHLDDNYVSIWGDPVTFNGDTDGVGSVGISNATINGNWAHTGGLTVSGWQGVTLDGVLANAQKIVIGKHTSNKVTPLKGTGTIVFHINDPAAPTSALNDSITMRWGRDTPLEKPEQPDPSIIYADGLTLDLRVNGALETGLQYPLIKWVEEYNGLTQQDEASGVIEGTFGVLNLPEGWEIFYQGTMEHPCAVVLAETATEVRHDVGFSVPASSATSPVNITGTFGSTIDQSGLAVLVNGSVHQHVMIAERQVMVDVPLSAAAATPIQLMDGGLQLVAGATEWSPTNALSGEAIWIRKGDSLLFSAPAGASIRIEAIDGGVYQSAEDVPPSGHIAREFSAPGAYQVIVSDNEQTIGSRRIDVVGITKRDLYCEVGYTRRVTWDVEHGADVLFARDEPTSLLDISDLAHDGTTIAANIRPSVISNLWCIWRLGDWRGPVVLATPVNEFTFSMRNRDGIWWTETAPDDSHILEGYAVISPKYDALDLKITLKRSGYTFLDGSTDHWASVADFTEYDGQWRYWYKMYKAPWAGSSLCHSGRIYHNGEQVGF